ncbi:DeoR/GlpR transcriptional regulator [Dolosicoccus paucivorans]|uniref:DeoR/GlpR family DNA-binding transcription regulator n=1 Tax=Dolosicoccus paucivorans TaxID=84521 RepID=UPI000C80DF04|nr:DeoR/GlpR family DNA-binding transcription regulator [Dolosicoccus paucivorans]PMB85163.1 DeoR/GlpR transcriptional regulator [Dolosicoccus paucivorans]
MLKSERLNEIANLVKLKESISVSDIVKRMNVSDMTVRRDLAELETQGVLRRVHGGAVRVDNFKGKELSHEVKQIINIDEKRRVSIEAIKYIEDEDVIFIGPGTTMEIMASLIDNRAITVITNCLPVFEHLNSKGIKVYLIGGEMREKTKAFNGDMANEILRKLKFNKAFVSANAVNDNEIMTATIEEGNTQALALKNSGEKYLIIDHTKIGKIDFNSYYQLGYLTKLIIDKSENNLSELKRFVEVIEVE